MATSNDTSDVIEIPLTKGFVAIVDREDCDWLNQWHWRTLLSNHTLPYAVCRKYINGSPLTIGMHRLIMEDVIGRELITGECIDHINNNSLDNRKINLRISTTAENSRNRGKSKNNTSGFKGVSNPYKDDSWIAIITIDRKNVFLGRFKDKLAAAQAYDRGALWYHGEFAKLNFPDFDYGVIEKPNRPRQKGRTLKSNR